MFDFIPQDTQIMTFIIGLFVVTLFGIVKLGGFIRSEFRFSKGQSKISKESAMKDRLKRWGSNLCIGYAFITMFPIMLIICVIAKCFANTRDSVETKIEEQLKNHCGNKEHGN